MVRYRQPTGKSTEKRGFKTKREATAWEAATLIDKNAGLFISESARKRKVGTFITEHLTLNPPVRDGALNRECPPDQVKWYLSRVHFDQSEEHLVDAI